MGRPPFPKARHLSVSLEDGSPARADGEVGSAEGPEQEALSSGSEALALPLGQARNEPAPAPAPASGKAAKPEGLPRAVVVDASAPVADSESCRAPDGAVAGAAQPVRCASSLEGREHLAESAAEAARLGEAVVLDGLDRWWRLGPDSAGYCDSCGAALVERLRESYGEHMLPFDALALVRPASPPQQIRARPFGGLREALRLSEAIEAGKRAALRARDEARRHRGVELPVLGRVEQLSPPALLLARHLDGLLFSLPTADPAQALLPLLAARAALGQRPAIAVAPAGASEAQVRQLAALALACDADLALPPNAARASLMALAEHRKYLGAMRERIKPAAPLADLGLLASPAADALTAGRHFAVASLAASAIARLHLQIAVALELPGPARTPLVLAGVGGLREDQALLARRQVSEGGDLLMIGRCALVDDEGRTLEKLFPDAKAGLNRVGQGRVWAVLPEEDPAPGPALEAQIVRAARELLGRGRASLTLTGRGALLVRGYLDPERKLDVHLVNLDVREAGPVPAQGITLHVAGQVAGGGRTGFWFAPDRDKGTDGERIALNPAGFGVSTVLPRVGTAAMLTIPR
jgi:hypothetical protein